MKINNRDCREEIYIHFIDLETNGIGTFNPPTQIITQCSWITTTLSGNIVKKQDFVVLGATSIKEGLQNSLSLEEIKLKGKKPEYVLDILYSSILEQDYVISHNSDFDVGTLVKTKAPPFHFRNIICTMRETTNFCKIINVSGNYRTYKWPKLSELCTKLNIEVEDEKFHDSLYDCTILKDCFFTLMNNQEFLDSTSSYEIFKLNKQMNTENELLTSKNE